MPPSFRSWVAALLLAAAIFAQAAEDVPMIAFDGSQLVFQVPLTFPRWNAAGAERLYSHTFRAGTIAEGSHDTPGFSWRLPTNTTFDFILNYFESSTTNRSRTRLKAGLPEVRLAMQQINRTTPPFFSSDVNDNAIVIETWFEEVVLDCNDRTDMSMLPDTINHREGLPCTCAPSNVSSSEWNPYEDVCFYCATSDRHFLLRERRNVTLKVWEPSPNMFSSPHVANAPYATVASIKTTVNGLPSNVVGQVPGQALIDIRNGFTVDDIYKAGWSPYVWDAYQERFPATQLFPNSSTMFQVKCIGSNNGPAPDEGTINASAVFTHYVLGTQFEPGLLVPKAIYDNQDDFVSWMERLKMGPDDKKVWWQRKQDQCASGSDHLLATNYSTVANQVNQDTKATRNCVPISDRLPPGLASHLEAFPFPADYAYAQAFPNTKAAKRKEGQYNVAMAYRLSCDLEDRHLVYSFKTNLTAFYD